MKPTGKRREWTAAEDRTLRRYAGRERVDRIAQRLQRSESSIKNRAWILGIRLGRGLREPWKAADLATLKAEYGTAPTAELAAKLGRSLTSVYAAAKKLGLAESMKIRGPDFDAFIRRQHAKGWSDQEIADAWSAKHPQRAADRRTCGDRRNQLGLPHNAYSEHRRQTVAAKTREQCQSAGVKSLAELRMQAHRRCARRRGWPEDLALRQVQILDFVYENGPQTRRAIAEHLGVAHKNQRNWFTASRNLPYCQKQYHGQNYIADLLHRGLLAKTGRIYRGEKNDRGTYQGRMVSKYFIPLSIQRNPRP